MCESVKCMEIDVGPKVHVFSKPVTCRCISFISIHEVTVLFNANYKKKFSDEICLIRRASYIKDVQLKFIFCRA
jgi:hypothetical protein